MCWRNNGYISTPGCIKIGPFAVNHAGQITRMSASGVPVVGRIATAPDATAGGLTISDVVSYYFGIVHGVPITAVAFRLTDTSYRPVNTSPALLSTLDGASDNHYQDALPNFLAPGDTLYATDGFDTTQITGLFCLEPNGGTGNLPCTTLSKA